VFDEEMPSMPLRMRVVKKIFTTSTRENQTNEKARI